MREVAIYLSCIAAAAAFGLLMSYGMASIGEPQSSWLWCDMIGICPGGSQ